MIPIATPIFVFVLPETIFVGALMLGIMFRALGILYIGRFVVKDDLNILGPSKTLHVLMMFYVMLRVIALLYYDAERSSTHSSIKTIGESFWYVIQMASGSTFGPSPVTFEGRIIGAIAIIVGSTLTGIYVSIITVWYITRKMIGNKGDLSRNKTDDYKQDKSIRGTKQQAYYNYAKRSVTIRAHNDISVYTVSSEKLVQVKSVALEGCLSTGSSVPII